MSIDACNLFSIFIGLVKGENITASFSPQDEVNLQAFKELGAGTYLDSVPVVQRSEVVFITVKPWVVPAVLKQVLTNSKDKLFISVAMGVKLKELEAVSFV